MKRSIEYDVECPSCKGTGLYVGLAEHDGAAVVCHSCRGKGHYLHRHEYKTFGSRKKIRGVKRVYSLNPGIVIGEGLGGKFKLEDFGGMPFKDWQSGKPFPPKSENRKFTCPAWWYQGADYKKKPAWTECASIGWFSDCRHFVNKEKCWERWDKEFGDNK